MTLTVFFSVDINSFVYFFSWYYAHYILMYKTDMVRLGDVKISFFFCYFLLSLFYSIRSNMNIIKLDHVKGIPIYPFSTPPPTPPAPNPFIQLDNLCDMRTLYIMYNRVYQSWVSYCTRRWLYVETWSTR